MINIISNDPNWAEVASAAGTVLTTICAVVALYGWRTQKNYELRMNAIAKGRLAMDLVFKLRQGHKSDELTLQAAKESIRYFSTVLKSERQLYEEVLIIKEQLRTNFGEAHNITSFYNKTLAIITALKFSHARRLKIINDGITKECEKEIKEIHNLIFFNSSENDVNYILDSKYEEIIDKKSLLSKLGVR